MEAGFQLFSFSLSLLSCLGPYTTTLSTSRVFHKENPSVIFISLGAMNGVTQHALYHWATSLARKDTIDWRGTLAGPEISLRNATTHAHVPRGPDKQPVPLRGCTPVLLTWWGTDNGPSSPRGEGGPGREVLLPSYKEGMAPGDYRRILGVCRGHPVERTNGSLLAWGPTSLC